MKKCHNQKVIKLQKRLATNLITEHLKLLDKKRIKISDNFSFFEAVNKILDEKKEIKEYSQQLTKYLKRQIFNQEDIDLNTYFENNTLSTTLNIPEESSNIPLNNLINEIRQLTNNDANIPLWMLSHSSQLWNISITLYVLDNIGDLKMEPFSQN